MPPIAPLPAKQLTIGSQNAAFAESTSLGLEAPAQTAQNRSSMSTVTAVIAHLK